MIKRLIVNADDYGLSEGVCLGILKAHRDGILTSTTCMMNMENIEKYLEMTKDYPNLGLGVHLNITVGKPLTNVSFVDEKGNFKSRDTYTNREEEDKYSYKASLEEIKENDYNLNIPRYVDTFEEEEVIDLNRVSADLKALEDEMKATNATIEAFCRELNISTPF